MVIVQFRQDLLHYSFSVKHRLGTDPELLTITIYGSQLAVIQVDDLPMLTHKRFLLLLKIFRIHSSSCLFLLLCHVSGYIQVISKPKFRTKLAYLWNILAIFVPNMNFQKHIFVLVRI